MSPFTVSWHARRAPAASVADDAQEISSPSAAFTLSAPASIAITHVAQAPTVQENSTGVSFASQTSNSEEPTSTSMVVEVSAKVIVGMVKSVGLQVNGLKVYAPFLPNLGRLRMLEIGSSSDFKSDLENLLRCFRGSFWPTATRLL